MARLTIATRATHTVGRVFPVGRLATLGLITIIILSTSASPAAAQFGALKRLKELKDAVSGPDSAAKVKDSLAKVHAIANGEVVPADSATGARSFLSRATSAAGKASAKFEKVTGVSTKDAVLAVSGAGVAGLAAKKLGVDPTSLVNNAVNGAVGKASASAQKKAMQATGGLPGMSGAPGMPSGAAMQVMQAMQGIQGMAAQGVASPNVGQTALMAGAPDAQMMIAFQQEMMQVAMAATAGDAGARAKLDGWQKISEKAEAELSKVSAAASGGDMAAFGKLQAIQVGAMREWVNKYGSKSAKAKP